MPPAFRTSAIRVVTLASLLALAACSDDGQAGGDDRQETGQADAGVLPDLPSPEGAIGSVTGMPAQPGPGTSPIAPAPTTSTSTSTGDPAPSGWINGAYVDLEGPATTQATDGMEHDVETATSLADPERPEGTLADAPPVIIVPELPAPPMAPVAPERPPEVPPPRTTPIGTAGATESTTIVVEPEPDD